MPASLRFEKNLLSLGLFGKSLGVFFLASWFILGNMALAQPSEQKKEVVILTLEKALKITMEKNKDIQKAKEYRNRVEGRYVEERAAALPQFVIHSGISRDRDESQAGAL